jgi:predicted metal-dependent hydrolase
MQHYLEFGSKKIEFTLTYQDRKSLGIKVNPDTTVHVSAPENRSEEEILKKLKSRAPWILKQIDHFNSFRPATPPRRFLSGETHLYLGRQYRLKVVQDNGNTVKAYRGQLFIYSSNTSAKALEKKLYQWYREKAVGVFDELLEETLPKFKKYSISKPAITIQTMSKRWGSCTSEGKLILNLELIKAPKGCIQYVLIHELCHLVHHNHTKEFFELQNRVMPDWKKWKERLEYGMV